MLTAGVGACFELDIKKVVALSTLRQLRVIIFSLSLGYYSLALFHLLRHALFKALLFVGVGCVIHRQDDWQDFRIARGLWLKMPLVRGCIILAGLALRGLPFLGGFYSKDLVVEKFLDGGTSMLLGFRVGAGLIMTIIYRGRLFFGRVMGDLSLKLAQRGENGLSVYEIIPLICLGLASRMGGWFLQGVVFDFRDLLLLEIRFKRFVNFIIFLGTVLLL